MISVPETVRPRSVALRDNPYPRFWWHHREGADRVPLIYQVLAGEAWAPIKWWRTATEAAEGLSEINVPTISILRGPVSGNGLSRIVQLGHYYGYSALLIGFWPRAMGGDLKQDRCRLDILRKP